MINVIYSGIFCVIVFFMWVSIIFSYADKKYGVEQLFSTTVKAMITYALSSIIALGLTVCTYFIVCFIQITFE